VVRPIGQAEPALRRFFPGEFFTYAAFFGCASSLMDADNNDKWDYI
jgi:hypothetical protein